MATCNDVVKQSDAANCESTRSVSKVIVTTWGKRQCYRHSILLNETTNSTNIAANVIITSLKTNSATNVIITSFKEEVSLINIEETPDAVLVKNRPKHTCWSVLIQYSVPFRVNSQTWCCILVPYMRKTHVILLHTRKKHMLYIFLFAYLLTQLHDWSWLVVRSVALFDRIRGSPYYSQGGHELVYFIGLV